VNVQMEWSVDDVARFIDQSCRSKFGNEKCDVYKRIVLENDVDGEVCRGSVLQISAVSRE
jgi:hypothetical protein